MLLAKASTPYQETKALILAQLIAEKLSFIVFYT